MAYIPARRSSVLGGFPGMGCAKCNGTCGKCSGMGLFESMDFTEWGIAEFAVIGVGAYLILSLAGDTKRVQQKVKRFRRRRAA